MVKLLCLFLLALVYAKEEFRGYDFFYKKQFCQRFLRAVDSETEHCFMDKRYHISNYHVPNIRISGNVNVLKPKLDTRSSSEASVQSFFTRKIFIGSKVINNFKCWPWKSNIVKFIRELLDEGGGGSGLENSAKWKRICGRVAINEEFSCHFLFNWCKFTNTCMLWKDNK